jgi:predicted DNA-binding transcriptional regulator
MEQGIDLIELLNIEYQRRCEKNKSYSFRAYARDLSVQPATLSHIMRRKRAAGPEIKQKIYDALKLSVEQRNYLNTQGNEDLHRFDKRDMDVFISLSEWYFDAICELVRLKGFESNVAFVSKRLGISREEAQSSVNRLFEIGLLKETPNKTWIDSNENSIVYGGDQTNFALQRLQRQLLEKAIEALEITPKKDREQASMVMAINKKDLPEAKTKIKEFHQELCKFMQRPNRDSDEVYQLVTSFFPLTKVEND